MSRPTILIVEDSSTDVLIMKHALRDTYDVEHATSIPEARQRLAQKRYAAIISDYACPGGTGIGLLRWLKEHGIDTPLVMVSGNGDEQIATEALKLGAYDYVVKSEDSLASIGITLKHASEQHELEQRAVMLQQIVENASDSILTMDASGKVLTANSAVESMFGYSAEELVGQPIQNLFPEERARRQLGSGLRSEYTASRGWQGELNARRKDGARLLINLSVSPLRAPGGKPTCLIGIARDMTERRQLLDKLKRLSVTDNLTGLFNHRFFHDRLRYEFLRAQRYRQPLACIMIDADYFKSVNDSYGHLVGDEVLKGLAKLVAEATRSVDIVARYGGEEFAVLLPNTDLHGAVKCAENIWANINRTDIPTQQGDLKVSVSVGVAALTPDIENEEELHRRADDALLLAKRRGRNNVCVWNPQIGDNDASLSDFLGEGLENICVNLRQLVGPARQRYMDTVRPVLDALSRRHPLLRRHSTNVTLYSMELARLMSLKPEEQDALQYAALFHDIGHVTTPPTILNKRGELTAEEREVVQRHVRTSETLMEELALSPLEIAYVRHHHERYDGQGYPDGLVGEDIPIGARILAIADAYDAMTSERSYRQRLPETEALEELQRNAGRQFDPKLVQLFIRSRETPAPVLDNLARE